MWRVKFCKEVDSFSEKIWNVLKANYFKVANFLGTNFRRDLFLRMTQWNLDFVGINFHEWDAFWYHFFTSVHFSTPFEWSFTTRKEKCHIAGVLCEPLIDKQNRKNSNLQISKPLKYIDMNDKMRYHYARVLYTLLLKNSLQKN